MSHSGEDRSLRLWDVDSGAEVLARLTQRKEGPVQDGTVKAQLKAGADPNARLKKHVWYMSYTFDLLDVDTRGATAFWRAAYATDVEAMKLLVAAGASRVITMDLHAPQIQGYFDIPVDHLDSSAVFIPYITQLKLENLTFAAPDVGATNRIREIASYFNAEMVICDKHRKRANEIASMVVIGDVAGHGITAAALFYYVGLLEERRGSRGIKDFGGLMQRTPLLCGWMSVAMFSSLGLPGLNGFIGEFLIFKGSFTLAATATSVAILGLLFTAIAFLRAMQMLFSGPLAESCSAFPDLLRREKLVIVPVTLLMFAVGVAPQFVFNIFNTTVVHMARLFV